MRYLGGKSKIAKRTAAAVLSNSSNRAVLYEPFVGGGAMLAALAPHFETVITSDVHHDLIMMLKAVQSGWVPPKEVSENQYKALKKSPSSAERGFVGFACSWGAKWWGGYARADGRNFADESSRSLVRDIAGLQNVRFHCRDYKKHYPGQGDVVYCDPPYADTTGYRDQFNSQEFWQVMRDWAASGAMVFVSEYEAPEDWQCIMEITRTRDLKSKMTNAEKVTEKLFMHTTQYQPQSRTDGPLFAS